ncbi:MAG: DUF711 family protein [Anaerolineae bacterium]|nr:DUF711 family protein [Anaerolineae bacterium]
MRIRSVTVGTRLAYPLEQERLAPLAAFQQRARALFDQNGLEVQTVRLATQPYPDILSSAGLERAVPFAREMEALCRSLGIDYCSIGAVIAAGQELAGLSVLPEIIRQTENIFAAALVAAPAFGINLAAIAAAAEAIVEIAHSTRDGFGNLRFAVLANCAPGAPFFPAAYHQDRDTTFAVATEAADLAVAAFQEAATLEEAQANLRRAVEETGQAIERVCRVLAEESGFRFAGIDFSLAPYPETARSIGHAVELLGVDAFGGSATLFAVALIARTLRKAQFPRCGFSSVLLPVLEDRTLARRSVDGLYTIDSLLLYSTVCGTGLDTIPLPGDTSAQELAAILLDVATLALVADKPLTARLMPIPGKSAGDMTDFDFAYFAPAQVLDVKRLGAGRIFRRDWRAIL